MKLIDKPSKITLPFANSGVKNTIPVASQIGITAGRASYTDGFPPLTMTQLEAGGVPPFGQDFNGVFYAMSQLDRWANAGAGFPYDGTFANDSNIGGYPKGAAVLRSDGKGYWVNLADDNITNPESSPTGWGIGQNSGITAITMTSSNYTLTPLEYGLGVIRITGLLTTDLNLIFPNISGTNWLIINSTTGSFNITAKTPSGSGIIIGDSTYVSCDGTNIISTKNDLSNSSNLSLGVSLVGGGIRAIDSIAQLRTMPKTLPCKNVYVKSYYGDNDTKGGGKYFYVASDTTSADNGGTIIVASDGGRWYLDYSKMLLSLYHFGGKSDNGTKSYAVHVRKVPCYVCS